MRGREVIIRNRERGALSLHPFVETSRLEICPQQLEKEAVGGLRPDFRLLWSSGKSDIAAAVDMAKPEGLVS